MSVSPTLRLIMNMKNIYIVDDDENIVLSLRMMLEEQGYKVFTYNNGLDAYDDIINEQPDLAVFDIKMPKMDGMELLRKVRAQQYHFPIIMLTSKSDETDQLDGFECGADDYITKPFSQKLLIARIKTLIKRLEIDIKPASVKDILNQGSLFIDFERLICEWKGISLVLTVTEIMLLKSIATRPGIVKTREQLITEVYGEDNFIDDRTVDSHVKRLRKKFKTIDEDFDAIQTLYGAGYKYKVE